MCIPLSACHPLHVPPAAWLTPCVSHRLCVSPPACLTFYVSVAQGLSVFLDGDLQVLVALQLHEGLSARPALPREGEVDAVAIVGYLTVWKTHTLKSLKKHTPYSRENTPYCQYASVRHIQTQLTVCKTHTHRCLSSAQIHLTVCKTHTHTHRCPSSTHTHTHRCLSSTQTQ